MPPFYNPATFSNQAGSELKDFWTLRHLVPFSLSDLNINQPLSHLERIWWIRSKILFGFFLSIPGSAFGLRRIWIGLVMLGLCQLRSRKLPSVQIGTRITLSDYATCMTLLLLAPLLGVRLQLIVRNEAVFTSMTWKYQMRGQWFAFFTRSWNNLRLEIESSPLPYCNSLISKYPNLEAPF